MLSPRLNPKPINLVFYQHALPLWLCLRQGLLCSSRRVTWLRLKSVFNFLVVSSFCGFIVKCIALWWKLMCLLRPWIVWLLTITFTEKNYNLENGYSGKASLLQIQIIIPKITTICVGYGAVFFGLSLVKKRK